MVEGGEVVVVELHLGALHDPVAEADEDVLDLAHRPSHEVACADRNRRGPRQGHVHRVHSEPTLELRRLELRPPAVQETLERLSRVVRGAADRPALGRGKLPDPAKDPRSARPCVPGTGPAARRARPRSRPRRSPPPPHGAAPRSWLGRQPWSAILRPSSYSATVAAIATLREAGPSGRIGIRALRCAIADSSGARPARSEPRQTTSGGASLHLVQRHLGPLVQRELRPREVRGLGPRRRPGEHGPHARRGPPSGSRGRRIPGPAPPARRTARARRGLSRPRSRGRGRRPGRRTALRRLGPPLAIDADHARPRAERADRANRSGSTSRPATSTSSGLAPAGLRGHDQVLPLGREQARPVALAGAAQLADQLQLLVVGGGDQRLSRRQAKKRRPADRGPPGSQWDMCRRATRWPPGLARQIGETPRGRAPRCPPASCGSPRPRRGRGRGSAASSSFPRAARPR